MTVIGLSGRMGAGKGTVAKYLKENYDAEQFVYSGILSDVLKRLDIPAERKNLQALGAGLREALGSEVLVHAMAADLKKSTAKIKLIDGLRYINEVDMLRTFADNLLIFLDVPSQTRFERVKARAEKGESILTFEEFQKREEAPTEAGLKDIKKQADFIVDNSKTVEDLYMQIDKILDGK